MDEAIAEAARDALQWHVHVPADAIKVRVEQGWITLSGNVDWGYQRRLAERTVSQLRGVIGVVNNIRMNEKTAPPMWNSASKRRCDAMPCVRPTISASRSRTAPPR